MLNEWRRIMKKKRFVCLISIALATMMLCSMLLSGCGLFEGGIFGNGGDDDASSTQQYTIQYTDDVGTHTLTVADGATYSLEAVPERLGYDFIGLFDAKTGGTQYVDETGQSLSPFTDKKNIVLFPQFAAKEYTVVLDYQGATITGERSVTAKYGERLPDLPQNLSKEHSVFAGWYTKEDCGGTQVADEYGLIPDKSTLNESLFDIEGAGEYLYLYAGFNVETFTVTFNFGSGIPSEEVEVEYNTPISEVVPETRNGKGQAVLSWSKTQSGEQIFTGNVTDDIVLYAAEWAPVIELDSNGGEAIAPVVARAGSSVSLPTPVRENYKFLHWETMSGTEANITKMPADGAQLKAVWQAMLVFDENGGTEVKDISQEAGTAITLPTPEKEGFIFAGWYTADEEKYTAASMPTVSVALKAGWYQAKEKTYILLAETETVKLSDKNFRATKKTYSIDLNEIIDDYQAGMIININLCFQFMNEDNTGYYDVTFTNSTEISSVSTYWNEKIYANGNTNYQQIERNITISTTSSALYLIFRPLPRGEYVYTTMKDLYYTIHYPDTTNLYL